jgi:hypothetical protein
LSLKAVAEEMPLFPLARRNDGNGFAEGQFGCLPLWVLPLPVLPTPGDAPRAVEGVVEGGGIESITDALEDEVERYHSERDSGRYEDQTRRLLKVTGTRQRFMAVEPIEALMR